MNIYVGNLDYQLIEDNLETAFQAYGEVESARIITDRDTGRSKGFGFVEMPEKEDALEAIKALNGTGLGEKTITVNEAHQKPQSNKGRGGFGGGRGGGGRGGDDRGGDDRGNRF